MKREMHNDRLFHLRSLPLVGDVTFICPNYFNDGTGDKQPPNSATGHNVWEMVCGSLAVAVGFWGDDADTVMRNGLSMLRAELELLAVAVRKELRK